MRSIDILIAEDCKLFRKGITLTLEDHPEIKVLGEADTGRELLTLLKNTKPDIVLMALSTTSVNNLEVVERITTQYPEVKIIVLYMFSEQVIIKDLIRLGVRGFFSKYDDPEELIHALEEIVDKDQYFDDTVTDVLIRDFDNNNLSAASKAAFNDKELQVLKYICEEYKTEEIADKLNLSVRTIEGYRKRLLEKSGSKNVAGLVVYTMKNSLVDLM